MSSRGAGHATPAGMSKHNVNPDHYKVAGPSDGIAEDPETLISTLTSTAGCPYMTGLGTVRLTLVDRPATPAIAAGDQRPQ